MTPEERRRIQRRGETAAATHLEQLGYQVIDLNEELAWNCPFADILAIHGDDRILVQVKATTTSDGLFGTPPIKAQRLDKMGAALGCRTVYAFVHLTDDRPTVRYATAALVAELAAAEELAYPGTNRFHVTIDLFEHITPPPASGTELVS